MFRKLMIVVSFLWLIVCAFMANHPAVWAICGLAGIVPSLGLIIVWLEKELVDMETKDDKK